MAVSGAPTQDSYIPLIDFSPFQPGRHADESAKQETAAQILNAFRNSGFIYLTNHGISTALLERTFAHSRAFFARPQADKDAVAWSTPRANRGYSCMGQEKVSQATSNSSVKEAREEEGEDLKESYEIGRPDDPTPGCENPWPKDAQGRVFERESLEFWFACKSLHAALMRALALGLGLEESWFERFTDGGDNTLRLLNYPRVKKSAFRAKKGQLRAGAHTDYGSCTFLFQDTRGGLQIKGPKGEWIDAKPVPETCVVNAADLLSRWSNDLINSTLHRVVEPPMDEAEKDEDGEEYYPARYSIAYFCNPDFDEMIEVIPGTVKQGETKKYDSINSGDYLVQRLEATY